MRYAALLAAVLLAGCATTSADDGEARSSSFAMSQLDLEQRLNAAGYFLSSRGLPRSPLFRTASSGREYVLSGPGGGVLQIYSFDSAQEAEQAVRRGWTDVGGFSDLRVYQSGPLVVGYFGGDFSVQSDLTRLLGRSRR